MKNDIANLKNNISKLEKKNEDSINKLNILTKFFKEQEKEYLKYVFNDIRLLYSNFYIVYKFFYYKYCLELGNTTKPKTNIINYKYKKIFVQIFTFSTYKYKFYFVLLF